MSSFLSQAHKKAEETVKEGEKVVEECVEKGKEVGEHVIEKGREAAKKTCNEVTGHVGETLSGGWPKKS